MKPAGRTSERLTSNASASKLPVWLMARVTETVSPASAVAAPRVVTICRAGSIKVTLAAKSD